MAYKRSTTIKGSYKSLCVEDGHLIDLETGEEVDLIKDFSDKYGENEFSVTSTYKQDFDLD